MDKETKPAAKTQHAPLPPAPVPARKPGLLVSRETTAGMVVAGVFLALVGAVIVTKTIVNPQRQQEMVKSQEAEPANTAANSTSSPSANHSESAERAAAKTSTDSVPAASRPKPVSEISAGPPTQSLPAPTNVTPANDKLSDFAATPSVNAPVIDGGLTMISPPDAGAIAAPAAPMNPVPSGISNPPAVEVVSPVSAAAPGPNNIQQVGEVGQIMLPSDLAIPAAPVVNAGDSDKKMAENLHDAKNALPKPKAKDDPFTSSSIQAPNDLVPVTTPRPPETEFKPASKGPITPVGGEAPILPPAIEPPPVLPPTPMAAPKKDDSLVLDPAPTITVPPEPKKNDSPKIELETVTNQRTEAAPPPTLKISKNVDKPSAPINIDTPIDSKDFGSPVRLDPQIQPAPKNEPAPAVINLNPKAEAPPAAAAPMAKKDGDYDEDLHPLKPNESYRAVSKQYYNSDAYALALQRYNSENPGQGDYVRIPPIWLLEKKYPADLSAGQTRPVAFTQTPVAAVTPRNDSVYTVSDNGELLADIARRQLGSEDAWQKIWNLNPQVNPARTIPGGTRLRMPSP